ncbi:ATPase, T2SS/T4P/T4SS family [Rhizobium sp.]|uniref:type IV pilus twitching motility protein PilT n=1 Tax=Rhizobium sp. TaxID=391 RepID=UPI0028B1B706
MIDRDLFSSETFDRDATYNPVLKSEPVRFDSDLKAFDAFLVGAASRGAADISIMSEGRPRIKVGGRQYMATKRILLRSEVDFLVGHLWRSADAASIINQGRALDFAYDIAVDRNTRQRFRVNVSGVMRDGAPGVEVTLRTLPNVTPRFEDVMFEPELIDYLNPASGVIVIAGGTGHGKSTTMAAITRHHIENRDNARKIIDYQAPIEFTFADLLTEHSDSASFIAQSEIGVGRNFPEFSQAVWASLRRGPSIINVGEARDIESIKGCLQASVTGHIVNTTTHAGSVIEALRRMVFEFPSAEQTARAFDMISALQLVIVQRLLKRADRPGLVAVREYLLFDEAVRERYYENSVDNWAHVTSGLMKEARTNPAILARSTGETARRFLDDGIIAASEAKRFIPRAMFAD